MSATPTLVGDQTIERTPAASGSRPPSHRSDSATSTSSSGSSWSGTGRFAAGTILASRYRIVAALGRGGMGEVFRAEDLTLQQEVALKFLPKELTNDQAALERFHKEVRVARQVSHPNVCRVFDIGVADGAPFITMEYVDGEDLSSLLRRIGRFPQDKGLEIARQICAGLAAAHEQGLLHRDLKPANVMLDGRGRVRITDFGLASLAGDIHAAEIRAGTPAYMAPEQIAGAEVTPKSDIYALGLVLYEIFTGKRAFDAPTLQELSKQRESSSPTNPTTLVKDLDPLIERVIERCLEKDPAKRPASALQVAAALPGGDPLAAALAAGETPSPEMVAAAGGKEGIRPWFVWSCVGIAAACMAFLFAVSGWTRLYRAVGLPKSPDVLEDRAKELIHSFGYTRTPYETAKGFDVDADYIAYIRAYDQSANRWSRGREAVSFWYRQSPTFFAARQILGNGFQGQVSSSDPPMEDRGMIEIGLDPDGRLQYFEVVTQELAPPETAPPLPSPDWNKLLTAAGFDPAACKPIAPGWNPPSFADARMAWTTPSLDRQNVAMTIEAAAYRGRPVYFTEIGPWTPRPGQSSDSNQANRISAIFAVCIVLSVLVAGIVLTRANFRKKRVDMSGSIRLALLVLIMEVLTWALGATHIAATWEAYSLTLDLAWACLAAVFMWMLYIALEPIVRRRMPSLLISWNRLLQGNFNDPLIGRDMLVGAALGLFALVLSAAHATYDGWRGLPPPIPNAVAFSVMDAGRSVFAQTLSSLVSAVFNGLVLLMVIVLVQIIVRNRWVTIAIFAAIFIGQSALGGGSLVDTYVVPTFAVALLLFVLLRFGLLATVIYYYVRQVSLAPITPDTSAWYAWMGWFGVAIIAAIVIYGMKTALAGQPLFGRGLTAVTDDA